MFNSTIEIEIRWRFFSWSFFIHFLRSKAPSTVATEHSHVTLTVRAAMSFIHTIVDTARNQATAQPASKKMISKKISMQKNLKNNE